jgi:hypothetical protein
MSVERPDNQLKCRKCNGILFMNNPSENIYEKKCECCGKDIVDYGVNKMCSSCSVFHKDIVTKANHYKQTIRELKILLYGQPDGAQRVRYKSELKGEKNE